MNKIIISEERDFKGVWIPKNVWLSEDLGWTEKLLLVEIESLDNEKGCYASNKYFHQFFGLSKDRISKMVSSLREKGYISVNLIYHEGSKEIKERIIRVDKKKFYGIEENNGTYNTKKLQGIVEKTYTPIGENAEDNNTSFNNTINNTVNNNYLSVDKSTDVKILIDFYKNLNNLPQPREITNTRSKSINARLKDYGLEELKNSLEYFNECNLVLRANEEKKNKKGGGWLTFDWIFNPNNMVKIVERKYEIGVKINGWNERPTNDFGFDKKLEDRVGF